MRERLNQQFKGKHWRPLRLTMKDNEDNRTSRRATGAQREPIFTFQSIAHSLGSLSDLVKSLIPAPQ